MMQIKNNEKKEPLVSVIIPVYNVENYVSRCLDSIINNTYSNLEIICIDDGSTDKSGEICDGFAKEDSRIIVLHKNNGGLSSARNAGLRIAKGDYITFIDSDDWIHQSFFDILVAAMINNQTDIAMCDYLRFKDGDILSLEIPKFETRIISSKEMLSGHYSKHNVWRKIYKRNLLDGVEFDETVVIEDDLFNFQVFKEYPDATVSEIPLKLYAYYQREGSLVTYHVEEDTLEFASKINNLAQDSDKSTRVFVASESIKRVLKARYILGLQGKRKNVCECNSLLNESIKMLNGTKNKLKYYPFVKCPILYRTFRIINDPSMLKYEKKIKQS